MHMAINDLAGGRVYHIDIPSEFLGHIFCVPSFFQINQPRLLTVIVIRQKIVAFHMAINDLAGGRVYHVDIPFEFLGHIFCLRCSLIEPLKL